MRGYMATHYIDNTGEIIVFTILFIFLVILSAVFITFLVIKINGRNTETKLSAGKRTQDSRSDVLSDKSNDKCNARTAEKLTAQKQHANAGMIGKEKYTAKLRRELDLVGILRWNEKRSGNPSSAVAELTGGESNTTELDVVKAECKVNEINRKLVDYSDTAGKFAMLDISKVGYRLTDGGNIEVSADISMKSVPCLGGRKAVLDGSLEVKVYSEKCTLLGTGYISADGFDETDLENAGFVQNNDKRRCHSYSAVCISEHPLDKKGTENCNVVIAPYHLWTIAL